MVLLVVVVDEDLEAVVVDEVVVLEGEEDHDNPRTIVSQYVNSVLIPDSFAFYD
uniref:hypothetical protein n=1 Tax=uncultured Rhizobium sp. TaxID=155567 RepID=UPI0026131F71|nr:hypothetical protein [uncultured Rhizobium sp.]